MDKKFIYGSLNALNINVSSFIQNTAIPKEKPMGISIDIEIFQDSDVIYKNEKPIKIGPNDIFSINEDIFPQKLSKTKEQLFVATVKADSFSCFYAQEHQVNFENDIARQLLIYDHIPYLENQKNDIVLFLPGIVIDRREDFYLNILSYGNINKSSLKSNDNFKFIIYTSDGYVLNTEIVEISINSSTVFNIKEILLKNKIPFKDGDVFSIIGIGQANRFLSFIIKKTANNLFAIEHTLPPYYYFDGNLKKVREYFSSLK